MKMIDRARQLRHTIEELSTTLDDENAIKNIELFPRWEYPHDYAADDRVRYDDVLYKCLQSHSSQETWTPVDAVSLWAKVLIPDPSVIPEWEQPGSTNPYMRGDKVRHSGKIWVSIIDNNVWEPGIYGWEETTE